MINKIILSNTSQNFFDAIINIKEKQLGHKLDNNKKKISFLTKTENNNNSNRFKLANEIKGNRGFGMLKARLSTKLNDENKSMLTNMFKKNKLKSMDIASNRLKIDYKPFYNYSFKNNYNISVARPRNSFYNSSTKESNNIGNLMANTNTFDKNSITYFKNNTKMIKNNNKFLKSDKLKKVFVLKNLKKSKINLYKQKFKDNKMQYNLLKKKIKSKSKSNKLNNELYYNKNSIYIENLLNDNNNLINKISKYY